jgi:asparagine synthase (glutamine-hydrolysing)
MYTPMMWDTLGDHDPYSDLDITNDRIGRWDPLNQSLYVGYRVMLAGMLTVAKGDRATRHSVVEGRYPFLDDDVAQFCSEIAPEYKLRGFTDKWLLRRVAARILPKPIANQKKTMFRADLSAVFLGPGRPAWVDQLLCPESLEASGYFDAEGVPAAREKEKGKAYFTPELVPVAQHDLVREFGPHAVREMQVCHLYRYLDFMTELNKSLQGGK